MAPRVRAVRSSVGLGRLAPGPATIGARLGKRRRGGEGAAPPHPSRTCTARQSRAGMARPAALTMKSMGNTTGLGPAPVLTRCAGFPGHSRHTPAQSRHEDPPAPSLTPSPCCRSPSRPPLTAMMRAAPTGARQSRLGHLELGSLARRQHAHLDRRSSLADQLGEPPRRPRRIAARRAAHGSANVPQWIGTAIRGRSIATACAARSGSRWPSPASGPHPHTGSNARSSESPRSAIEANRSVSAGEVGAAGPAHDVADGVGRRTERPPPPIVYRRCRDQRHPANRELLRPLPAHEHPSTRLAATTPPPAGARAEDLSAPALGASAYPRGRRAGARAPPRRPAPGHRRARRSAPAAPTLPRRTGSVSTRTPSISSSTVACPSHVTDAVGAVGVDLRDPERRRPTASSPEPDEAWGRHTRYSAAWMKRTTQRTVRWPNGARRRHGSGLSPSRCTGSSRRSPCSWRRRSSRT